MHAGQIVVPYPGGKLRLAHLRSRLTEGVYREGGVTLHVSPGARARPSSRSGSSRRPEVTELVLRSTVVEGQSLISPDVLASYAADAAREVAGVRDLVAASGVKVARDEGRVGVELHLMLEWGANAGTVGAEVQAHVADCLARMADVRPDDRRRRRGRVAQRVFGLTGATLSGRRPSARRASGGSRARAGRRTRSAGSSGPRTTGAPGARSTATTTAACSARSSTAPRSSSRAPPSCPPGPPSDDAVLVTCVYLVSSAAPWVEQSLFLAAIGEARDKGAKALEAFAYRYPEGESAYERFLVHRTVFPRDFLADFGFQPVRRAGPRRALRGSSSAACCRSSRASARGAAGRQGGVRAGARPAAALASGSGPSRRP